MPLASPNALLPGKLLILQPVRDDAVEPEAALLVFLVVGEIALEPFDMAVAFEGQQKLEEEIAALDIELRIDLPREISKARAHGDLSENAEYHAAKERQGIVNMRLGQLRARLRELSMVDMARIPRDRVGLGSTVTVLDLTKDEEVTYQLLTSEEADVAQGRISTTSPIGKALLGKQVGDTVKVMIPEAPVRWKSSS